MGRKIKIGDLLKQKKPGDEWYTVEAPEEFHVWQRKSPWKAACFREYGAAVLGVRFVGRAGPGSSIEKFTRLEPLRLANGEVIESGHLSNYQSKKCGVYFRVDDVAHLNATMIALSDQTEIVFWETQRLDVYMSKIGSELLFRVFNPNGVKCSLFLERATINGDDRPYPLVPLPELRKAVGGFEKDMAFCVAELDEGVRPGCAIKAGREKKRFLELKKKEFSTKIHLGA